MELAVDRVSKEEWSRSASAFADYSLYQTWDYGEVCAAAEASAVSRILVRSGSTTIGMAQCRIRSIPLTRLGIAYIYWGPLWRRDGVVHKDIQNIISAILHQYGRSQGLLVRIVPRVFKGDQGEPFAQALMAAGLRQSTHIKPYRTFLLDLSPPLEDLHRALARRWRRALKRSEGRQIRILCGCEDGQWARLLPLYDEMLRRKQFASAVDPRLFGEVQRRLPAGEKMSIQLALSKDQPVAALVSSHLGDTCLGLLGASNEVGRRCQAAYLLHWQNIQKAKAAGLRWYDLGGIDLQRNPDGHLFKAGLGGSDCELLGAFEACESKVGHAALSAAERTCRWLKRSTRTLQWA